MSTALAHIAIAVTDLDSTASIYTALGFRLSAPEIIEHEHVRLQKAVKGETCVELLESYPPGAGPIAKFISRRGAGLHHLALHTADVGLELNQLKLHGITALPGYPAAGASGSLVAFLDPGTTGGVLLELVQSVTS